VGEGNADIGARASETQVGGSAACHVRGLNADHDGGGSGYACAMRIGGERAWMWTTGRGRIRVRPIGLRA
jgi:hypothetical protein